MKLKYIFLSVFVFVTASNIIAQHDIKDTIRVTALQPFQVPDDRFIVLTNIFKADFSAELLDDRFQKIRNAGDFTQIPSANELVRMTGGGRGATVQFSLKDMIEKPGIYYIKINISSRSEVSQKAVSVYYMVNVSLPMLAANINLKPSYYFSEKESFSFYTLQYSDYNLYSYRIEDASGTVLENGRGAVVNLNGILKDLKNVGKTIKVTGMYRGQKFNYIKPGTSSSNESVWSFSVKKPLLDEFSDWQKSDAYKDLSISAYDRNAMRILYTYIGNTESGFVVVAPEAKNFQLRAEPEGFIINPSAKKAGNFLYISFSINEQMLADMEKCSEKKVKMVIKFTTQFGENIERTYDASILK